MESIPIG
jgi:Mg2+ and Co2+ transporter CorA